MFGNRTHSVARARPYSGITAMAYKYVAIVAAMMPIKKNNNKGYLTHL